VQDEPRAFNLTHAVFLGDIVAMGWPGQVNFDFTSFLTLSALWLAWRHQFSQVGIALGLLGFFGGGLFFSAKGDMKELLLGKVRANS
jgi:hypothetical protein